jgi:hypothetical protein
MLSNKYLTIINIVSNTVTCKRHTTWLFYSRSIEKGIEN